MSDIADRAQVIEESGRDDALAAHQRRPREVPFVIQGVRVCIECYVRISQKRLTAQPDAVRCVHCQRKRERRAALGMA